MPVRVRAVELRRVRLPLRRPFRSAAAALGHKDALLVRVVSDDGDGWGEVGVLAHPTYTAETLDTARGALRDELVPRLLAGAGFDDVRGHHAARAALECAVLDVRLRAEGRALAAHLGGRSADVPAGVAIGIHDDPAALAATAGAYAAEGYTSLKLKIAPGRDVAFVSAARAAVGDGVTLQADANGSYEPDDAGQLARLDELGLACLEQPLAPDALLDHARLASRLATPIALDETITSAVTARDAIEAGACRVVSVKTALVGGIAEARRIHDRCIAAGVAARAGGMLETGVGRAVLVALASLPGFTVTGDLSASDRYFEHDVTEPFELRAGRLTVPAGPGLGVTPRPDVLARCTVAREVVRAGR